MPNPVPIPTAADVTKPVLGLYNVGTNCWLNSILQVLEACTSIQDLFKKYRSFIVNDIGRDTILRTLSDFFHFRNHPLTDDHDKQVVHLRLYNLMESKIADQPDDDTPPSKEIIDVPIDDNSREYIVVRVGNQQEVQFMYNNLLMYLEEDLISTAEKAPWAVEMKLSLYETLLVEFTERSHSNQLHHFNSFCSTLYIHDENVDLKLLHAKAAETHRKGNKRQKIIMDGAKALELSTYLHKFEKRDGKDVESYYIRNHPKVLVIMWCYANPDQQIPVPSEYGIPAKTSDIGVESVQYELRGYITRSSIKDNPNASHYVSQIVHESVMYNVNDIKVQQVPKQQNTSCAVMMSVYQKKDYTLETCEEVKHRVDVEGNQRADVGGIVQRTEVEGNQRADVEAHQSADVGGNQRTEVEGNQRADVEAHQRADVGGNQRRTEVEGNQRVDVEAHQRADVEVHHRAEVEARERDKLEAHQRVAVEANQRAEVEAREGAEFEAKQRVEVEANQRVDVKSREWALVLAREKDVCSGGSVVESNKRKNDRNVAGKNNNCRGKPIGAKTWSDLETNTLLDAVENILPMTVHQWADVIKLCEEKYTDNWKRHKDACKHKFEKLYLFKPALKETPAMIPLVVNRARLIRSKIDDKVRRSKPMIEITDNIEDNSEYKIQLADAIITAVQSVNKNVLSDRRLEQLEQKIVKMENELDTIKNLLKGINEKLK